MNTKNLVAAILGGLASFLTGWLVHGVLLRSTMEGLRGSASGVMKNETEMMDMTNMLYILIGNIVLGYLLTFVFSRWATISSVTSGAIAGATLIGLFTLGFGFITYGTSNLMQLPAVFLDALGNAVWGAASGAVIGWWLGRK